MEKNAKRLAEEGIIKLLINFSIPAIVGMLVISTYSVIDRIFVGRFVGSLAISGMGLTFPISLVLMAFGMLIGIGASARISIRLGQQKKEEAELILGNALTLLIIFAVVLGAAGLIFLDPLLKLFGASPDTLPYGKQFISIILAGSIFQFIGFGLNGVIGSEGNPRIGMMTMILNALLNILLLILFIYYLHFGVRGSAVATLIAQFVSACWVFFYLRSKNSMLKIKLKNMALKKEIVWGIISIGMAPFLMQFSGSIVTLILNKSLSLYGGDIAIGALSIIFSLTMLLIMPIIGVTQGAQPIIGYNYGAKKFDRVKKTLKIAVIVATVHATLVFTLIQYFPGFFISLFTNDAELIRNGVYGIRIYLLMLPVIGFQIVSANFFLAIGKSVKSMLLNLLRQVIVLIPLLFILPKILKLQGVWISVPISDFTAAVLTAGFLLIEIKNLNREHAKVLKEEQNVCPPEAEECYRPAEASEYIL